MTQDSGLYNWKPFTKDYVIYVILILLVAVAFGTSLQNSFVWDSMALIVNNPNIDLQWKEIPSVFITPMWKLAGSDGLQVYYRPIPSLFTVLNYKIWGLNPFGFHLTTILFHLINTIVLYRVGLLLFSSDNIINSPIHPFTHSPSLIAFFSASIFAVHPVHAEPVCFASGEVILGFFIITTLYFYLKGNEYLSLFAFFLALLSKESAVMFPFALVILAIHRDGIKKGLFTIVPYIVLVITYLILRLQFVDSVFGGIPAQPLSTRLFTMAVATLDYIRLLLVPYPLGPYYPARWYTSILEPKVLTAIVVLTSISYLAFRIRKDKIMLFLLSFPFIMLAPVIWGAHSFTVGNEYVFIAERFLYVPVMAFVLFISASLMKFFKDTTRTYLVICLVAVTIIFAGITRSSTGIWKNNITLFERIIERTPNTAFAHNNLGNAFKEKGRYKDALVEYQTALRLKPDYAEAYYNIGGVYGDSGMYKEAIEAYKQALRINPSYGEAYYNLGIVYSKSGMYKEAIKAYEQAIMIVPYLVVNAYYGLGVAYSKSGMYKEAIEAFKEAIRIKPDYVKAYYNIGVIYGESGMYKEAIEVYKYVLRLKPDNADIYYNLGINYGRLGMHKEAIEAYKQSIKIKPDIADVHLNLALTYLALKDRDSALEEYKILKDLSPKLADKLLNRIYKK
jgi:tetratricopeptide (TPR) repeat protein